MLWCAAWVRGLCSRGFCPVPPQAVGSWAGDTVTEGPALRRQPGLRSPSPGLQRLGPNQLGHFLPQAPASPLPPPTGTGVWVGHNSGLSGDEVGVGVGSGWQPGGTLAMRFLSS